MTVNGIEIDGEAREDERADLIALAGRMARGEVEGYQGVTCAAIVRALVDELGGALTMARDTFGDFERVNRAIGRELQADAAKVARDHAAGVLARLEP